ncbi:MAG: mannose-1-phosphate guanylyltransferase [Pseudomonadota bacterium]
MTYSPMIIPVILCGGSGTRLWPLSRESMPKQFLNLMGEETLLQATALRAMLTAKVPADNIVTVTLAAMKDQVAAQYNEINPALSKHILSEPMPKNTSAAIAFAANYVKKTFGPDALMWILAADHHMSNVKALREALLTAIESALSDNLVTFGIKPSRPETGYGYIKTGAEQIVSGALFVSEFVEKPSLEKAEAYIASGDYLWNSGMFLFKVDTVLKSYKKHDPSTLELIEKSMNVAAYKQAIPSNVYIAMAAQPFDKAIMEKEIKLSVIPCDPKWSDIGSWESLWEVSNKDEDGNAVEGYTYLTQTNDCLVKSHKTLIACAGVNNLVIVETEDAILIADKSNGSAIKELVSRLRKDGVKQAFHNPQTITNNVIDRRIEKFPRKL